jgi:hypothetical protein
MQETIDEQIVRAHKGLADFAFVITHLSIEDVIKRIGNATYEEALSTHGNIRILVDGQLLHEFTDIANA